MMIADLVDQDDLFDHLKALGLPLEHAENADHCCRAAAQWLAGADDATRAVVAQRVALLLEQQNLLLPEVKLALEAHLLPLVQV